MVSAPLLVLAECGSPGDGTIFLDRLHDAGASHAPGPPDGARNSEDPATSRGIDY